MLTLFALVAFAGVAACAGDDGGELAACVIAAGHWLKSSSVQPAFFKVFAQAVALAAFAAWHVSPIGMWCPT